MHRLPYRDEDLLLEHALTSLQAFCEWLARMAGVERLAPDDRVRDRTDALSQAMLIAAIEMAVGESFPEELVSTIETPREWYGFALVKLSHNAGPPIEL